jgi:hypothetical protein
MSHTDEMIQDNKYFQNLILNKANVNTILGLSNLIEGSGKVNILHVAKRNKILY